MSDTVGTVRVSRDFFDDGAFKSEPFTEREAFLWMIMEASFKPRERRIGRESVILERGQLATSMRFLQKAWGWASTRRVHSFICALQKRNMLRNAAGTGFSVITLCNYDKYQSVSSDAERERNAKRNARGTNENKDAIREEREAIASLVPQGRGKRKTRIPETATISEKMRAAAVARGLSDAEAEAQFLKFRDWAVAKGQAYADWDAAWRNWLTSPYFAPVLGAVHPLKPEKADGRPSRSDQRLDAFLRGATG
jgi:hypothetical protein